MSLKLRLTPPMTSPNVCGEGIHISDTKYETLIFLPSAISQHLVWVSGSYTSYNEHKII